MYQLSIKMMIWWTRSCIRSISKAS